MEKSWDVIYINVCVCAIVINLEVEYYTTRTCDKEQYVVQLLLWVWRDDPPVSSTLCSSIIHKELSTTFMTTFSQLLQCYNRTQPKIHLTTVKDELKTFRIKPKKLIKIILLLICINYLFYPGSWYKINHNFTSSIKQCIKVVKQTCVTLTSTQNTQKQDSNG